MNHVVPCQKNALKNVPSTHGIYIFLDKNTPLYIGKSVNLKARLSSHFENAKIDAKEFQIISHSDKIHFIVTDSEFKSLLLESKLIQKYGPKYNVRWRDDKSYLYIKVTLKDEYPKIFITRAEHTKGALYFGPFASTQIVKKLLKDLRRIFPFCTQKMLGKKPCFYSKIGLCKPCPSTIENVPDEKKKSTLKREYRKNIRNIIKLLQGNIDKTITAIEHKIKVHTKNQRFEQAIILRDQLHRLKILLTFGDFDQNTLSEYNQSEKRIQSLTKILSLHFPVKSLHRIECYDMSTLGFDSSTASMVVFEDGLADKSEYKRFKIKSDARSDFEMFEEVLRRRFRHSWPLPDLIIIDGGRPQLRLVLSTFRDLKISIPTIGIAKRPDRIIFGVHDFPMLKPPVNHDGFRLVQALRDESHRFAKKYHIRLREKRMV